MTGGTGFIGANLARLLLNKAIGCGSYTTSARAGREYLDGLDLEVVEGDILDSETVAQAVAGVDSVVHLAAQTGVPGSLQEPRFDCEVNVVGTLTLLEACRHAGVSGFVFASSNAPLGRQPHLLLKTKHRRLSPLMAPASWQVKAIVWLTTAHGAWEQWSCALPISIAPTLPTKTA